MAWLDIFENVYITNNRDVEMELLDGNGIITMPKGTIFRVDSCFNEYMRVVSDNYGDHLIGYINHIDGLYDFV